MYKKRDARAKLFFCRKSCRIPFCRSCCRRRRRRRLSCLLHDYDAKVRKLKFGIGHEGRTTALVFFFLTLLQSLRIHFQKKLPTFDDMNQTEKAR